jgi:hypothetical protein
VQGACILIELIVLIYNPKKDPTLPVLEDLLPPLALVQALLGAQGPLNLQLIPLILDNKVEIHLEYADKIAKDKDKDILLELGSGISIDLLISRNTNFVGFWY